MTLYAVIVLYNKNYKESATFNCIKNEKDIEIIVCDNSTKDCGNSELSEMPNVTYINMGGNMGLSKAYNKAVEAIGTNENYMCIFDDDTQLPQNYFSEMYAKIEETHADIILPLVHDNYGYMSPSMINGVKVYRINTPDELTDENITGINSGMVVRLSVFNDFKYDEGYFLDYIDHAFVREMKRQKKHIAVADKVVLEQDFSGNDHEHYDAAKNRFKLFYKDFWHFCSVEHSVKHMLYAAGYLTYRWLYLHIVIKNYQFFKRLLKK